MFDKKKIFILPLAALALTVSGTAFANTNNQLAEQAIYGSKSPIVQDKYTNEATAGVTKTTPAMKLSDEAVYGLKSPIVQDKYTNEATAGVTKTTPAMKLSDHAVYGSKSPFVQDKYTNEG
jgi:hypothetical protein